MENDDSDTEGLEVLGDWDYPPPVKGTRVSDKEVGGGSTSTVAGGRVLPPWADPSYQWGGGKWKEDGRKNKKKNTNNNKKKKKKKKKIESDLSVEDLMNEYSSLPPQIAEWYWCIEYVAKFVKDIRCLLDLMNIGYPPTNDYGSRINEIVSLRILEFLFDPNENDAASLVGPRIEFDLSFTNTHVLNAILKHIPLSELRPGMPELSNFNLLPFISHKNMSFPQCALEKLRDMSAMEDDHTSAAPTMEADDRSEDRDVCEEMAIDEEQAHTGLEQTNMDHEDSPPVQTNERDEVVEIDGNDITAEQPINEGNTTREASSPSLDVRVKRTKDGAWLICDESDEELDIVKGPGLVKKSANVCWKCEREGGASLLICSRSECAAKVHRECLNCEVNFDEDDNFHCPVCWYDRMSMEYIECGKLKSCAKRRLVKFLPLFCKANKRLR